MDSQARRREIRKRKILQNADDRLKKVTTHHEEIKQKTLNSEEMCATESKSDFQTVDNLGVECSESEHIEPKSAENGKLSGGEGVKNGKEADIANDMNGHDATTKCKRFVEVHREKEEEEEDTRVSKKETHSKFRTLIVIVSAFLWFYQSTLWSMITEMTGLFTARQVEKHSSITIFCLLELFLLCIPSARKVVPGKNVNIWILALKLCGVSPLVLERIQYIILLFLAFITDLTMFIFVLVVLQNITELLG